MGRDQEIFFNPLGDIAARQERVAQRHAVAIVAREEKTGTCSVAPYEIGQIDFDYIVDHFFWDTDFLAAEHLLELTTQHRQRVGFSDEAWSVAAGLRPHPDELAIQIWEDEAGWDAEPDEYPSSGTISLYPRE